MNPYEELEKEGIECSDLDGVVHDAASGLGSDANNDGLHGQVEFLKVVCGWSDEEILEAAKTCKEED